jgi:hypothetical protein
MSASELVQYDAVSGACPERRWRWCRVVNSTGVSRHPDRLEEIAVNRFVRVACVTIAARIVLAGTARACEGINESAKACAASERTRSEA